MTGKKLPEVIVAEDKIITVRGQRVMLDSDLSSLYGVATNVFNQAVKRNSDRFPEDLMFRLNTGEFQQVEALRSQSVTSKKRGGRRYLPHVVTEQGVAMLSSVLNSKRAIQVNIAIMRAFVKLRSMASVHKELASKIIELEGKYSRHDRALREVFEAIRQLAEEPPVPKKRRIGF